MRFVGGAIGPDEVLVWTGERELTRFHRRGSRSSFTVPFAAEASQIGEALWLVDGRGTIHRYDLTGRHEGAVALAKPVEPIVSASLSGDASQLALVVGEEAHVYEGGVESDWYIDRSIAATSFYTERGIELSRDGNWALVDYFTNYGWSEYGTTGARGEGVKVVARDGKIRYDDFDSRSDSELMMAVSPDGSWIARARELDFYITHTDEGRDQYVSSEPVRHMIFSERYFAALFDARITLVDLACRLSSRIELPEHGFRAIVLAERDVVAIHDELGAWWLSYDGFTDWED